MGSEMNSGGALPWHGRIVQHQRALVIGIFVLALLVRHSYTTFLVGLDSPPSYDGVGYDTFATQIAEGEGYHTEQGPTAHKPPLYPFFLAGIYNLLELNNYPAVRVVQALMGAVSAVLTYLLGRRMFNPVAGVLAGLGVSVHPLFVYMTGELYPETLYILLFSLILVVALRLSTSDPTDASWWSAASCGALLGLTALSRPNVLIFLPALVVWPFLNVGWRPAGRFAVLTALVAGLVLLPWTIRNYVVFDELVFLSTEGGVAFWQGNNAFSAGGGTLADESVWPNADYPDLGFYGWSELTEAESSSKFFSEGLRWIRENPAQFISLIPRKILRTWSPISFTTQSNRVAHPLTRIIVFPYLLFLILAAYGAVISLRAWRLVFPLYAIPLLTSLQAAIFFGGTRYGISMGPLLTIFAAVGLEKLVHKLYPALKRRRGNE